MVLLATALYLLLPVVQPLSSFQRLGTTGTEVTQGDLNGRTEQWRQGIRAFMEHPVQGVGTDMYRSVNTLNKVAHNSYLSVLVEEGLIGFVMFASILAIVALRVRAPAEVGPELLDDHAVRLGDRRVHAHVGAPEDAPGCS